MSRWTKKIAVCTAALLMIGSFRSPVSADNSNTPNPAPQGTEQTRQVYGQLTVEGVANATVYVGNNGDALMPTCKSELIQIVKLISGAELTESTELTNDGLQIVLATPKSLPAVSTEFADDISWIGNTDGFAIRMVNNKVYILGATEKGVLNGVYDFLEENAGILWTRGVDELGTLYSSNPTIEISSVNYREKSPFFLRGWNACGQGSTGQYWIDPPTRWMEARNKINFGGLATEIGSLEMEGLTYTGTGSTVMMSGTTLMFNKYLESHPEYYMTNADGTPKKSQYGSNLNFYNLEAADVLADEILNTAQKNKVEYVGHSIQDTQYFCMVVPDENGSLVDLSTLPFTTETGVTVTPDQKNYKSTVFFNFLNRTARKLKQLDPSIKIVTLAYIYCEYTPAIPIEDNIVIQFAPIYGDDHAPIETAASNQQVKKNLEDWAALTKNIVVYNYYASLPSPIYSRPIAYKVQKDYQYYARLGLLGLTPEGAIDSAPPYVNYSAWSMNHLYYWLMDRLMWNPDEDLDALTKEFCEKAYGDGADAMYQYYSLIQQGWDKFDDYVWYATGGDTYIKKFIIDAGIADDALKALNQAYEASDELGKKRIKLIRDIFVEQIEKYKNFVPEDGAAYYTDAGKEAVISTENLTTNQGIWSEIRPLTVFKNPDLQDPGRKIEVRLMWDKENVYVAYSIYNEKIGTEENPYDKVPPLLADGTWWNGGPEYMETYLCGNMTNMTYYTAFFTDASDQKIQYDAGPTFVNGPYKWESHSAVIADGSPEERYWMNVLVVPFETLGVNYTTATLGGTFIANIVDPTNPSIYFGWCGSNVWSTASFRLIEMKTLKPEQDPEELEKEKKLLQLAVTEAEKRQENDYTADTWTPFRNALIDARQVLEKANATYTEVRTARISLESAMKALKKPEYTVDDLNKAIAEAELIAQDPNTLGAWNTWKAFMDALQNAKETASNTEATEKDIFDAATALWNAKKALLGINKVRAHSLSLLDCIGVNFYATLSEETKNNPNAYVLFTLDGKETRVPVSQALRNGSKTVTKDGIDYDCYKFTCKVYAVQMAKTITAKLYSGENDPAPVDFGFYAVKDYLKDVPADDESLNAVVKAMLNYGFYAQINFNEYPEDLPCEPSEVSDKPIPNIDARILTELATDKIKYRSSNLMLQSETKLRINFNAVGNVQLGDLSTNKGKIGKAGSSYYVEIPINAVDLDTFQNVEVKYNGEVQFRIQESAFSYANRALESTKASNDLKKALNALYLYNQAAKTYFKEHNN